MSVDVQRCVIDGRNVASLDDVYDLLVSQLDFPPHFGRNLDALWDSLTADVPGPVAILWEYAEASRKTLGTGFDRIVRVLRQAADARDDLTFTITG